MWGRREGLPLLTLPRTLGRVGSSPGGRDCSSTQGPPSNQGRGSQVEFCASGSSGLFLFLVNQSEDCSPNHVQFHDLKLSLASGGPLLV